MMLLNFMQLKLVAIKKYKIVKKEDRLEKPSPPIFQDVFGKLVCEIAQNRKDTVCITAAMREGTGLVPYSKMFPDRYYDVGIAEGHAVTFASGLASQELDPLLQFTQLFYKEPMIISYMIVQFNIYR